MFKEPFSVYLADFGEIVRIDGVKYTAIFDCEYTPDSGFDFVVGNTDPQLLLADETLPSNLADAVIEARGKQYTVAEISPDGTGITMIQLKAKYDGKSDY